MTFTQEEEDILKLVVAEFKARCLKNKELKTMQQEIQAQFNTIDAQIRQEHDEAVTQLKANHTASLEAIDNYFKE